MQRAFVSALLTAVCLALATPASLADVYKWVDEDGVTHFSQTPPPDNASERVETPSVPAGDSGASNIKSRLDKLQEAGSKKGDEQDKGEQQAADKEKLAKVREENCKKARNNLKTLTENRRILSKNEGGEPVRLTEEQRQARVKKMRDYIDENCSE